MRTIQNQNKINQNADFEKPDFSQKPTTLTKSTKFYKLNLPKQKPKRKCADFESLQN